VELSAGIQASLSGRYASALFELASEAGNVTAIESDLDKLDAALRESKQLAGFIRNPEVARADFTKAMAALGKYLKLDKLTRNFLGVLAQNRRVAALPDVIRSFRTIAAAQRGEVTARVTSAHKLSAEQLKALETRLKAREGRTVKLTADVDPELLGGLVVTIGSKRIDGSIRSRLNSLAQAMKG
jgi:F-type H+-transporting ATPase subunit delta